MQTPGFQDQRPRNTFDGHVKEASGEIHQKVREDISSVWVKETLEKLANDSYHKNEKDLVSAVVLILRITEWLDGRDTVLSDHMWTAQEQVERALVFGKPKDEDELFRCLIRDERGLYRHKMITKSEAFLNADLLYNAYCNV